MKRSLFTLLALALCAALLLCACGKKDPAPAVPDGPVTPDDSATPVEPVQPTEPTVPIEPPQPAEPAPPALPQIASDSRTGSYTPGGDVPELLQYDLTWPVCDELPGVSLYYQQQSAELVSYFESDVEGVQSRYADAVEYHMEFMPDVHEMGFSVMRNDGATLSILQDLYEHLGGAHPGMSYFARTWRVESETLLTLDDLFTVPESEWLPRILQAVEAQMDQREAEDGPLYYESARADLADLFGADDFYLTEDSLVVFFNEYSIGPYMIGAQFFEIPLSDLSDIIEAWL